MPTPIILLPGLKSDHRVWAAQIAALQPLASATVPPSAALDADRIEIMADRVLAAAPERFALAGCSMGGYVALAIMRLAPQRVERLALLSTSARPELPATTEKRLAALDLARQQGIAAMAQAGLERDFHSMSCRKQYAALMVAMAEEIGLPAVERQMQAVIHRFDARPALSAIRCPTLVLAGLQDEVTPPDCAREIAAHISGSELHLLPDCGHCANLEAPQAVNRLLIEWLRS
ncbi:alpha/beta fold hydrolase [Ferrovibrio sp.]|uniref:alpha/beta fold hydrolase n=1 Tax=Ferrovibrio sp. TaxID=1917215 RepID=UPI0025BC6CDF|nr:alpha/beta fold hydrolase [Ferrovibrio sp.]MBX3456418.1 alpha/beta fold hydrolase [Ferrovibrio sp.]